MKPAYQRAMLVAALAGTLVAAWFAPADGDNDVVPVQRGARVADREPARNTHSPEGTRSAARQNIDVLRIRERGMGGADDELRARLFDPAQWDRAAHASATQMTTATPPPLPPAASAAASEAAAQAPPPPFLVLGRYREGGKAVVFLQHMDRNLVVRAGDTIAGQYKVEALSDSALTLRYLPLDQVQSLALDGSRSVREEPGNQP